MNAPELLRAYLANVQNPAVAAALFAEEGVIELPTVNARAPGTSRMCPSSKKPTVEMVMTVMYAQSPSPQRPAPSTK